MTNKSKYAEALGYIEKCLSFPEKNNVPILMKKQGLMHLGAIRQALEQASTEQPRVDVEGLKIEIQNLLTYDERRDKSQWDIAHITIDHLAAEGYLSAKDPLGHHIKSINNLGYDVQIVIKKGGE